jgi:uncharacterized caspase-like protein/ketosteroid isomerase-like protein
MDVRVTRRLAAAVLACLAWAVLAASGWAEQGSGFTPPMRGAPEGRTGGASRDIGAVEATRVALVIGNGSYQNLPRLDNPASDAQLMATTLKSLGFELVGGGAATNLDRAGFEKAIREFGAKLNGSAVGLFYYAGHGVQVQGSNYLVPVGANPTNTADVDFELINAELVLRQMEAAGSKLNIVILDACRNNPFGGRGLRASGGGLAQMQAPQGTLISYATQPGNVALDGANGHSPYTQALAAEMRRPGERVLDVFNAVGLAVDKATNGRQQPWVASSPLEGNFYFAAAPATPAQADTPAAPAAPRGSDAELLFWQSIMANGTAADYEEYLKQFPDGRFAGLARNRMAALKAPERPMPAPVKPCGGNANEQLTRPVIALYRAVNDRDIDTYAAQWTDDATFRDMRTGMVRTKAEKISERRGKFAAWEAVNLKMDKMQVMSRSDTRAEITVVYSMSIKFPGQPPRGENNVTEQYTVVCGPAGDWLIRSNVDEINSR